jgi:hypothetical protein
VNCPGGVARRHLVNRAAVISIAFLLASTVVIAQTGSQSQPKTTFISVTLPSNNCPVSLHARHAGSGGMREVDGVPINRPAQILHLDVTNPDSKQIVAANVTVRGFADKARFMPATTTQDNSDAARTLDVKFPVSSGNETAADLRVPGFTAVTAIDLNSVTYSDGSSWKLANGGSCRSWVDGLMLVSSH